MQHAVLVLPISIHAPAKGATSQYLPVAVRGTHFNPRSREGSDTSCRCSDLLPSHFNPRSREGSDYRFNGMDFGFEISIHALAKGATCCSVSLSIKYRFQSTLPRRERPGRQNRSRHRFTFQSTLPRRERHNAALCNGFGGLFQSTLPRRERPGSIGRYYAVCHFNPRSREGSDGFSQCH